MKLIGFTIAVLCLFFPCSSAFAADVLNTGDTAWMIVATALVMVMTPGRSGPVLRRYVQV